MDTPGKETHVEFFEAKRHCAARTAHTLELTRNLRRGMEGDDVWAVKQRLLALGFYAPRITAVTHKRFGSDTRRAVIAFQAANGLAEDGVVGLITFAALFGESTDTAETAADGTASAGAVPDTGRGEIPANIGDTAAKAIWSDLQGANETRRGIVLDALQFAFDPNVPAQYPLSLYIRGGNLYNKDLSPNVITLSRIASGANRQPEYYNGGRREMMEAAVAANPSVTGADCSGGVVGLLRHAKVVSARFDLSADGFKASSSVRSVVRDDLLCADFVHKSGHIGLYAGGGYAVEWMGGAYGCQLTMLSGRRGWDFVYGKRRTRSAWTAYLHPTYY
ncbi:MAG TPA: peptidoglycan-binding domain-containing protein [Eubacteriales bacterium]|nr:peptidoglycan-binding domain-containing protein [Eubacteriales bacterium]